MDNKNNQKNETSPNACGEPCEVYSRVTGYFRSVSNWNKGKKEEFKNRTPYKIAKNEKHFEHK